MWHLLKDSKQLACRYEFIALGSEVRVGLMNRTERSEEGILEKLDADVVGEATTCGFDHEGMIMWGKC